VKAIGAIAQVFDEDVPHSSVTTHQVAFSNGSRIIALPADPDTARSYEGDVTLDEFAFHKDARKIYEAVAPSITRGYSLRIISTPNGKQGAYYELATEAGLTGSHASSSRWSAQKVDLLTAIAQGFKDRNGRLVDAAIVRASCYDEDMWLQEYMCQFISTASQWISPELFAQNVDPDARDGNPSAQYQNLYAGWDVARKKDLSVIWLMEKVGDVSWTRGILEMRNMPTPDQMDEARRLMPQIKRLSIDMSSMGLTIFEQLQKEFGAKIEGVQFTLANKEALAVNAKRIMEESKARIPDTDMIRNSFRSVRKTTSPTGQARFDAEHDEQYGHADHWWAFCLAEEAGYRKIDGVLDYYRELYEKAEESKDKSRIPGRGSPMRDGIREGIFG
jgi:phage FluMu gp28-like protein